MHQDAHEFLNYLLNDMSETLAREAKARGPPATAASAPASCKAAGGAQALHARTPSLQALHEMHQSAEATSGHAAPIRTWLDELFRGRLVSETRCLRCEAVTTREEPFYDLSLEIDQNVSLTSCLRRFSGTETLDGADKFSCDACGCKQEAQKRMRLAALPPVLCLHLKRFKYVESLGRLRKLMHRVVFPFELKLVNATANPQYENGIFYWAAKYTIELGQNLNIYTGEYLGWDVDIANMGKRAVYYDANMNKTVRLITEELNPSQPVSEPRFLKNSGELIKSIDANGDTIIGWESQIRWIRRRPDPEFNMALLWS
jgi:ubiquitin C-terminal hydrolase